MVRKTKNIWRAAGLRARNGIVNERRSEEKGQTGNKTCIADSDRKVTANLHNKYQISTVLFMKSMSEYSNASNILQLGYVFVRV